MLQSLLDEAGLADVSRAAEAVRKAVEQEEFDKATALWSVTETVVEQVSRDVDTVTQCIYIHLKMAILMKCNDWHYLITYEIEGSFNSKVCHEKAHVHTETFGNVCMIVTYWWK